ncbi:hypothetical protein AOZ06_27370 [Kibdelosporangium phytohabitans]|uniref:DUF2599 domain-containing protein n=1 Tax=Kibdelosporangium phytohabitans TaxID=860235 RepID=A0A0N9HXK9_9PSEU|nr:hypothetical protein AOZ06_27370 [Kibdelosporangium phytohabitans]
MLDQDSKKNAVEFGVENAAVSLTADGLANLKAANGETWFVAPPLVSDARGHKVQAKFTTNGANLTLTLDKNHDAAYPIVANTVMATALFRNLYADFWKNDFRFNGDLTVAGWAVYISGPMGQLTLNNSGWKEWTKKFPDITNKPTLNQQYRCHVLGALAAGQWNLERARRNMSSNLWHDWFVKRCNW